MTTIISTIAIYLIALIIIGIIEQNVSHTQTATEAAQQTWRRSKYSREFKYYDEPKQYARKSRVLDIKTGPTTAKIETTVGVRIPHYNSTATPRYKYTTTSTPSSTPSGRTTTTFTKITTINSPNTGAVSGTSTGRLKFTPIIVQSSSTSTTPRLISNKNTSKKPSVTTQKTISSKPTYKLTSSSIQEVTTLKPTSTVADDSSTDSTSTTHETSRIHTYYHQKLKEKPKVKIQTNISQNLVPLPAGAGAALVKPTKYHYYPHNQHIYLLPECAIQQVCNAVYVRLNYTQPLCACPSRYRDPCSASLNSDDLHTTELITDPNGRRALTLVKTCEPTSEMRQCRAPRDWSLLALQNIRTGKSHYLVICRCPENSILEGPISHDQPTYASVPGIRVYGMMCVQLIGYNRKRDARPLRFARSIRPPFPTRHLNHLISNATWD